MFSRSSQLQLEADTYPTRTMSDSNLSKPMHSMTEMSKINIGDIRLSFQEDGKLSSMEDLQQLICPDSLSKPPSGGGRTHGLIELVGQSLPESMDLHPATQQDEDTDTVINRVTDRTFPAVVQEEIFNDYKMGGGYDAVWMCEGGRYRVHKLILAMSSAFLRVRLRNYFLYTLYLVLKFSFV